MKEVKRVYLTAVMAVTLTVTGCGIDSDKKSGDTILSGGQEESVQAYITHGTLEDYYIYLDDGDKPAYHLRFDYYGGAAPEAFMDRYIGIIL